MKKALSLVLVLIISVCSLSFSAQANSDKTFGTCGRNLKWSLNKETSTLTISGTGEMTNYEYKVEIDKRAKDYIRYSRSYSTSFNSPFKNMEYKNLIISEGVTSVGKYAFADSSVKSVELPKSLVSIGKGAFEYTTIKDIALPESMTCIEENALKGTQLSKIHIPKNLYKIHISNFEISTLKSITVDDENKCFADIEGVLYNANKTKIISFPRAKKLNEFVMPSGVEIIGRRAFYGAKIKNFAFCGSLKKISSEAFACAKNIRFTNYPKALESIGDYAFIGCKNIIKYKIGENVREIGENIFADCEKLEKIFVGSKNKYFSSDKGVLFNKKQTKLILFPSGKKGKYTVPKTVKTIEEYAFYRSKLKSINLNQVKTVKEYAFLSSEIKSFNLGKKLKTIGDSAFENCKMKSISFPKSIRKIGKEAFLMCFHIKKIEFSSTKNLPKIGNRAFMFFKRPMHPKKITFVVKNNNIHQALLKKLKKGLGITKYKVVVK